MRSSEKIKPPTEPQRDEKSALDKLDRELDDSFPASDPPQSTQPHSRIGGPVRASSENANKSDKP
jgi:hypothetical protein